MHEVKRSYGDLLAEGWPKANWTDGGRRLQRRRDGGRHAYAETTPIRAIRWTNPQREITVTEAYGLFDLEGEGKLGYRRILKGGTYIHENGSWTTTRSRCSSPILMPYKLLGIGFFDLSRICSGSRPR